MKKSDPVYEPLQPDIIDKLPVSTSEDKYEAIIENSLHAFFLTIPDGTILEVNRAATNIFGYSAAEFKQIKRQQIIDHDDPNLLRAIELRGKKGYVTAKATGIRKNGERFPVEFASACFLNAHGEERASTMLTDISDRENIKRVLRESELRYKMFLQQFTEGIWRVDLDKPLPLTMPPGEMIAYAYEHAFIAECNDIFARMYGFENASKIVGLPLKKLLPLENPVNLGFLESFFNNGFKVREQVSYEYDKDGNQFVYVNNMAGIVQDGFIQSAWGIQRDITLQKKAENELMLAKERNDLIFRATNDAVWDWDVRTNKIWSNDTYHQVMGIDEQDSLYDYSSFVEKIHPDDRDRVLSNFNKAFENKKSSITEEFRCKVPDGSYRTFYDRAYMLYDADGTLYRMSGAMLDITDTKNTQNALAESEDRLRTIVESEPECIKVINEKGELTDMNPAGLAMLEAEHLDQLKGRKIEEVVSPKYRQAFIQLNKKVLQGGSGKLQFEVIGLKGTIRFLETHAVPMKNRSNGTTEILGITRDITENKKAETQLQASEERYRYLFNNNPLTIVIWDIETLEIREVNKTAIDLYGYTQEEFLKLTVLDLRPENEHSRFLDLVLEARKNGFEKKTMTWKHINKHGDSFVMEISSHKIIYNGENSVLALGNNITEKVMLENSLAEEREIRQQQIRDAMISGQEKERSQLGEELHDNINQILATTRLYIDRALQDTIPRTDLINESKVLLEKAMKEIRNLSKSLLPPSLGEMGLLDALDELTENIFGLHSTEVKKEWNHFPEKLLNDKIKLTLFRIVQEQLSNISKHAKAKRVTIRLKKNDHFIRLLITDDGIGFNTTLKKGGLGLRNMASRAELNKGTLLIRSAPGEGCEVEAIFPIEPME